MTPRLSASHCLVLPTNWPIFDLVSIYRPDESPSLKLTLADRLFRALGRPRQAYDLLVNLIGFITSEPNHIERLVSGPCR
jgi:hypothetical protein